MKPLFHPELVNGVWGDPALYIECLFEKRALMFDLGDLHQLAPRKILRLSHVFVSHTHMDHFVGFDQLLRVCLGRQKKLCLFGPIGFIQQVQSRLGGYSWNLVQNYENDFILEVGEVDGQSVKKAAFRCRQRFTREDLPQVHSSDGLLLDEEAFTVRYAQFDHKIPSLGFALQERQHINIWKNCLSEWGLPTGPWLRELKEAIFRGASDREPFRVWWREGDTIKEKSYPLGELKAGILRIVPGQKIAYATDLVYHQANIQQVVKLARNADMFYIESTFLRTDEAQAAHTCHLTAHQAGLMARQAGVQRLRTFHYSPRYSGPADRFQEEALRAFAAGEVSG